LSKWEKINIARQIKKLAEDIWELDNLEPIDDTSDAKLLIDRIKKDLK
jgi:post-segregation antitoxin (ccd killing protein)